VFQVKTEVFLTKEQQLKQVNITDHSKPNISDSYIEKWQNIITIAAENIDVPAALIMKITADAMTVVVKSNTKDNPYKKGDSDDLGHGLYCETVIGTNKKLFIKNALKDEHWKNNPDINLKMISYYGLPINWPDGQIFGTICILNNTEMTLDSKQINLFDTFKEMIEEDLALLVSHKETNNFFEINLDLLCIANTKGEFVKVNKAWQALLGYTPKDLEGMSFLEFIHPEDLKATKKAIGRLENSKNVINFINRFKDQHGNYHSIEWRSQTEGDYIYAAARNITDKIVQNEKIELQKDKLNWIIEGTDAGTWEWDILTDITVFNDKWAGMLGYTLEELLPTTKKTLEKLIHPKDLEIVERNLKKHFNGETQYYDAEFRMRHKKGHWVWINGRGKITAWTKAKNPLKIFGTHLNITKRKEKEKQLEDAQALIKNLTDQVPGIIYQLKLSPNRQRSIPYASKGIYELYEVSPKAVIKDATKVFNRIHPDDYDQVIHSIEVSAKNLSVWRNIHRVILPEQGEKWLEAEAIPEKLEDGSIIWHGSIRDITNKKKQHAFQKTLAEISSNLLTINPSTIDEAIDDALKKIGEYFEVERSNIFQLIHEENVMRNTHEWTKPGMKRHKNQLQALAIEKFPWAMGKLYNSKIVNIPDIEDISHAQKAEQELLKILDLKSITAMPIFIEAELFGFFSFSSVKRKRVFSKEELRLLKIFTDVITSAFSKYIYDQKILELTYKDSLTGLYNRRYFKHELLRLDTKRQLPISIIIADINGLKIINDSLGHDKGDELLIKSANVLKNIIRKKDILAREGGDEFAILLPKTKKEEAEEIINRVKQVAKVTKADALTVSIALGTATKKTIEENIFDILKKADNNMYQNKLSESKSTKNKIVKSLLSTLEVKSNETKEHAVRMTTLAMTFGKKLGLSNYELNRLALLSTLHDIGKTTIPEEILKKPGKLDAKEWEIIKKHPESGYRIANSSQEFALVAEAIYAHHEQWSGNGYPRQLAGEEIPYLARIISIIDAYDVMTNERPYKKAMSKKDALKEIEDCADYQFDPVLATQFIEMMQKKKE